MIGTAVELYQPRTCTPARSGSAAGSQAVSPNANIHKKPKAMRLISSPDGWSRQIRPRQRITLLTPYDALNAVLSRAEDSVEGQPHRHPWRHEITELNGSLGPPQQSQPYMKISRQPHLRTRLIRFYGQPKRSGPDNPAEYTATSSAFLSLGAYSPEADADEVAIRIYIRRVAG